MTNSLSTIPINRLNSNELNEKINTSVEEKANIDLSNTPFANLENVDGTLTWDGNTLLKSGDVDTSSFANTSASNFTATGKTTIVGWSMPNYNSASSRSLNTTYTAATNGWLELYGGGGGNGGYGVDGGVYITINDSKKYFSHTLGEGRTWTRVWYPIPKGTKYLGSVQGGLNEKLEMTWYPCVGG